MRACDAGSDDFSRLQFRIKIGLFGDIAEITSLKSV